MTPAINSSNRTRSENIFDSKRILDCKGKAAEAPRAVRARAARWPVLLFAAFLVGGSGLLADAHAGGVTQTRTSDTPQQFAGIIVHGAPVLVPDPAFPPGAGALIDEHKNVFGPGANWVQDTVFQVGKFRGQSSAGGATEIRHQVAPHGEPPTGVKLFGVSTARQVFPFPGAPGFALGVDVERKTYKHGAHIDNYGMLILAGFRRNNVTGYLGFLIGTHTVPVKKSFFAPLGPDRSYFYEDDGGAPPFGGAVISLDDASGKEAEGDLVLIGAMGIAADAVKGAYLYSGTPERPGHVVMEGDRKPSRSRRGTSAPPSFRKTTFRPGRSTP